MRGNCCALFTVLLTIRQTTTCEIQSTDIASFVQQDVVCSLPPPSQWIHRPVFIQADDSTTRVLNNKNSRRNSTNVGKELVLGKPIPFESDLFRGHIVIRIANTATTTNNDKDDNQNIAFRQQHRHGPHHLLSSSSSSTSWLWQYTIQGRFRESIPMDQLYMGEIYDKPLVGIPPSWIMKAVRKILSILVPGINFHIDHPTNPKVLAPLGGTIHTLRVDEPGHQPDIMNRIDDDGNGDDLVVESSTAISPQFTSASTRKSILRHPQQAAAFSYDTHHVYTFQHMDSVMDYAQYKVNLTPGILQVDLVPHMNGQAMSLGVVCTTDNVRWMFRFRIWNERTVMTEQDKCQFCDAEGPNI